MNFLPLAENGFNLFDASKVSGLGFLMVLAVLAVLAIFVKLLSGIISKGSKAAKKVGGEPSAVENSSVAPVAVPAVENEVTEEAEEPLVPHIPGYVVLDGVSEQDAAVIMAITSYKTGIGLERLSFNSITRLNQDPVLENISEQDAAAIMAIVADKTGIPLENLCFNSIKLVEE